MPLYAFFACKYLAFLDFVTKFRYILQTKNRLFSSLLKFIIREEKKLFKKVKMRLSVCRKYDNFLQERREKKESNKKNKHWIFILFLLFTWIFCVVFWWPSVAQLSCFPWFL